MNFERGIDPKEALKIGRSANAIKIVGYEIDGSVDLGNGKMRQHKYSTSDKDGTKKLLESLEKIGRLDASDVKDFFISSYRKNKRIKDSAKIGDVHIQSVRISVRTEYDSMYGNVRSVLSWYLSGRNLIHEDQLYVVPGCEVLIPWL